MLWIKSLHVIFMVTWFAGLFYLPRVFVYHAMALADSDQAVVTRQAQSETFKVMERKLLIMTHIGGVLTVVFGTWLLFGWLGPLLNQGWMHWKLAMVAVLIAYHLYCTRLVANFREDRNTRSHQWYRVFNEVPVLFLFGIVIMVIVRPSL